jgi:hypothetical protein
MTITSYQVDSVLNAYSKQNKVKINNALPKENAPVGKYKDIVSLSTKEDIKAEEFDIISYKVSDVVLKGK